MKQNLQKKAERKVRFMVNTRMQTRSYHGVRFKLTLARATVGKLKKIKKLPKGARWPPSGLAENP